MNTVNYIKKDIRDMDVMELIEEIIETTKIAALNLWGTNRERTNIAIDECAQKMKDIRLKADDVKLIDAFDNVMITIRVFENLNKIINAKVIRKSVQNIVEEMLDKSLVTPITSYPPMLISPFIVNPESDNPPPLPPVVLLSTYFLLAAELSVVGVSGRP